MCKQVWRYWGKALPKYTSNVLEHAFVYHSLDVVAVAQAWMAQSKRVQRIFKEYAPWVYFFIALHDLGKLCIRFQAKSTDAVRRLGNYIFIPDATLRRHRSLQYHHGPEGFGWLKAELATYLPDTTSENIYERWERWEPWMGAVAGHHGAICVAKQVSRIREPEEDKIARQEWVQAAANLFLRPSRLSLCNDPPPLSGEMQSILAGFCSVCDWLGSHEDFTYSTIPTFKLHTYLKERIPIAESLLRQSGIVRSPLTKGGIAVALNEQYSPQQVQRYIDRLPLGAGLTIIEAPTGSGKTEAALGYASRLLAEGLADSIIFALPTQATANAMLTRLETIAPRLFPNTDSNIVLAHGRARYNKHAIRLKRRTVQSEEEATVHQTEWLAQSRKRVFLGQIGVCTVDQVLLSVLPVRHHFVRSFSIGRSVLIIDEVHAYDAYMYGLLQRVLEQQCAAKGPVILLSATLPAHQRRQLIQAWNPNVEVPESQAYPLITQVIKDKVKLSQINSEDRPPARLVYMQACRVPHFFPDEAMIASIVSAAEAGARIAVIVNVVDDAQRLARILRERTTIPVDLFHARFRFRDRMGREEEVLDTYGKQQLLSRVHESEFKSQGRILVATQVVEQSLDLDFDWMITQLCPADLLFQRLGRLHRDTSLPRPSGFEVPRCTVLLGLPDVGYEIHGVIYGDHRALWRTEQLLLKIPEGDPIQFPEAYRQWIEEVYRDEDGDEPEAIRRAYDEYWCQQSVALQTARQLSEQRVTLNDSDSTVVALTRDGERSLNVVPILAEQAHTTLLDGTILKLIDEFERQEVIMLETVNVPQGWKRQLPEADEEGVIYLPMKPESNGVWVGTYDKTAFRYTQEYGLERVTQ
jgi:CRISPR-associated endonuclease/helicase Cas3